MRKFLVLKCHRRSDIFFSEIPLLPLHQYNAKAQDCLSLQGTQIVPYSDFDILLCLDAIVPTVIECEKKSQGVIFSVYNPSLLVRELKIKGQL